ncbi:MAG: alanine racemase, partial [Abditibacteriales bacterium]|nr:alanine racemase [Abditibacteriales bacterium]
AIGKTIDVLVEVNIAGEATKSGVAPHEVEALIRQAADLPHLRVRGLMTLPPPFDDPEKSRPYFRTLRMLREELSQKNIPNVELVHLSMGLTADFEVAIEEGATLVRIGTGIFGPRSG